MEEKITVYNTKPPRNCRPFGRKKFYDSQIKYYKMHGRPSISADIVAIFLFNEHGEVLIQKRSRTKRHNPNLQDKSIGGHVKWGDKPDYAVVVETVQELKVPSIVLKTNEDFIKTYNLLRNYLDTIAIVKHVDTRFMKLPKLIDGESVVIGNKVNLYMGVYHGRVKAEDREAKGVLTYLIQDLIDEVSQFPKAYTDDLRIMLNLYSDQITDFVNIISRR